MFDVRSEIIGPCDQRRSKKKKVREAKLKEIF
jgi:hypothetical protein